MLSFLANRVPIRQGAFLALSGMAQVGVLDQGLTTFFTKRPIMRCRIVGNAPGPLIHQRAQ